jgi:membrane protein
VPAAALSGSAITLLNLLLGRSLQALGVRFQAYGVVGCILLFTLWIWIVGALLYYGHCFAVVRGRFFQGRRSAPQLSPSR